MSYAKKVVIHSLLLIVASNCIPTIPKNNIKTKATEPTATIITSTPTVPSSIEGIKPNRHKICPVIAEIPLVELGLPADLFVFAVNGTENLGDSSQPLHSKILLFSGTSPTPSRIEKVVPPTDENLIIDARLSPSGLWMAIFYWQKGSLTESIWIRTIDGKKLWKAADISVGQRVFWVSDNEILVTGVPNETDYEGRIREEDTMPLISIDPFTLITHILSPLPAGTIYVPNSYHSEDGNSYAMYYNQDNQKKAYFLYDYTKGTSTPIFPWIDFSDPTIGVGIRPNGLYYVASYKSGVDFALDLNFDEIAHINGYNEAMKHLSIGGAHNLIISPMFSLTKSNILILTGANDLSDNQKPTPIYLYDYEANILKDYCLELVQSSVSVDVSPDEQFVAFTVVEFLDRDVYYIVILNLNTGHYSVIENMKAIGFGVAQ